MDGVWITASEDILHAVLETVDDVSRYRVSSHLHQVDRVFDSLRLFGASRPAYHTFSIQSLSPYWKPEANR